MVKFTVRTIHTGITNQLGFYFAGLIEGDGYIILRQGERENISPPPKKSVLLLVKMRFLCMKNYRRF